MTALDNELARAYRYRRRFAVLFLDIDHFKALNDTYGHVVGDAALKSFAALLASRVRGVDTVGRWGGEEFVILLPETEGEGALMIAECLRTTVAAHTFAAGAGLHLTCSVGVAVYPTDGDTREQLIMAADQAMYAAKMLGRNQVRGVGEPAVRALAVQTARATTWEEHALVGAVEALARVVEARDHSTGEHTQEVGRLVEHMALSVGMDAADARMMARAGRLHDVGKVAVPDAILLKQGPLNAEEWSVMRGHVVIGAEIVGWVPGLRAIAPVVRAHHEHWDGRGYPDALAGTAIPLGARIISVADAFSVMTMDRPYREARTDAWALDELRRGAGTQFDPAIVDALEGVLAAADASRPLAETAYSGSATTTDSSP